MPFIAISTVRWSSLYKIVHLLNKSRLNIWSTFSEGILQSKAQMFESSENWWSKTVSFLK